MVLPLPNNQKKELIADNLNDSTAIPSHQKGGYEKKFPEGKGKDV